MFWTTSPLLQWSDGAGIVVVTPPTVTDTAGGVGRRRHHKEYVEIDGEYFPVESREQAIKILKALEQTAKDAAAAQAAEVVAARPKVKRADVPPPPTPRVRGSPNLFASLGVDVVRAQADADAAYRAAYYAAIDRAIRHQEQLQQQADATEAMDVLDAVNNYEFQMLSNYLDD